MDLATFAAGVGLDERELREHPFSKPGNRQSPVAAGLALKLQREPRPDIEVHAKTDRGDGWVLLTFADETTFHLVIDGVDAESAHISNCCVFGKDIKA